MTEDHIRYDQLIDKAMRQVVKEALEKVKKDGLPGDHHFLISFYTSYEGVELPANLLQKYPEEMTIVIQHQYEDLEITDDLFKIVLSFDGKKERIVIPYPALTSFADPGVRFGLKFNILAEEALLEEINEEFDEEFKKKAAKKPKKMDKKTKTKIATSKNVVDLSKLRKDK